MKRRVVQGFVLLAVLGGLTACGGGPSSAGDAAGESAPAAAGATAAEPAAETPNTSGAAARSGKVTSLEVCAGINEILVQLSNYRTPARVKHALQAHMESVFEYKDALDEMTADNMNTLTSQRCSQRAQRAFTAAGIKDFSEL